MASPQAENGHIDIANEVAEALMKINLSAYEWRVLWLILRKTYGWHKKMDKISLSQFSKHTGLDRRLVHRALKTLLVKNIIVICRDDKFNISYGFQKNYEKWNLSSKKMTVIDRDDQLSSKEMTKVSSVEIPTKENIQKKLTTKEKGTAATSGNEINNKKEEIKPTWLPEKEFNEYMKMRQKIRKPMTPKAIELAVKKLEKLKNEGYEPRAVLEQSIFNSWQGLFPLKEDRGRTKGQAESTTEWVKRKQKEMEAKGEKDESF